MSVMNKLMNTKLNKKGFTLAELLIVVAIIAVLVAISIPIFTSQLEKSKAATDAANIRACYAEAMANAILADGATASSTTSFTAQTTGSDKFTKYNIELPANGPTAGITMTVGTKYKVTYTAASSSGSTTTPAAWSVVTA